MIDQPRIIFVNSPQPWAASKVSKHHYARELAARGHEVYFIEPPVIGERGAPRVAAGPYPRLSIVTYGTFFPYRLKFHARPLFDLLMRSQARRLVRAIGKRPDIIWDFDNAYQYADLSAFGAELAIFHPVDDLPARLTSTKKADVVFSNAQRYIDRLTPLPRFARVIDHGLSRAFIDRAKAVTRDPAGAGPGGGARPVVAYVGNLDRPGIDWAAVAAMAADLPQVRFVLIGPFGVSGDGPPAPLRACANVAFPGPKTTEEILVFAREVDIWLMAYDRARDIDGGTNPHKLLEYLATGKAVVSNWAEAYVGKDLVLMPPTPDNAPLPALLAEAIARLGQLNSPAEQARRAAYTLNFSYAAHLVAIDATLKAALEARGAP